MDHFFRYKSPRGYPIDAKRCAASVQTSGTWSQHHQCSNARRDGTEWCGTHDPDKAAAREKVRQYKRVAKATAAYKRAPMRKVEALQKELAALSVAYEARGIAHGVCLCDKISAKTDLARHRVAVGGLQNDKARLEAEVKRLRAQVVDAFLEGHGLDGARISQGCSWDSSDAKLALNPAPEVKP